MLKRRKPIGLRLLFNILSFSQLLIHLLDNLHYLFYRKYCSIRNNFFIDYQCWQRHYTISHHFAKISYFLELGIAFELFRRNRRILQQQLTWLGHWPQDFNLHYTSPPYFVLQPHYNKIQRALCELFMTYCQTTWKIKNFR